VIVLNESEINKKRELLYDYLLLSYVPLMSVGVRRGWLKWFTQYWRDEITFKELFVVCSVEEKEFVDSFEIFFKEEDLK